MEQYWAPPSFKTMVRLMRETGKAYSRQYPMDECEDDEEGNNYVEFQMFDRPCLATRANELWQV